MTQQQLGKYILHESLGIGATAEVFRAEDTVLGREVALKVLKPALVTDPGAFARFAREAQAAAQLFHPHIALVLDMGSGGDRYYIAMQYIAGRSLERVLAEEGPLRWEEALGLAEQIGGALAFAHGRGFLHRDVKPANILRSAEGYVLTDFGLTRAMMATGLTSHTGAVLGTPAYIPPEVWLGQEATAAADEYALACVLVEALTGDVLFAGKTPPAVMTRHVLTGAELPESWPAGVPEGAGDVLARSLAKKPDARYGGPEKLAGALADVVRVRWEQVAGARRQAEEAAQKQREAEVASRRQREAEGAARCRREAERQPMASLTLAPGVEMAFVEVPAGPFLMGSNPKRDTHAYGNEQPQREVTLDGYWIGKYPVTNAQYAAFVKATGHRVAQHFEGGCSPPKDPLSFCEWGSYGKEQHPVVGVSWRDAVAFCEWATQVGGRVIRLPTEAEWEKAARGTDGRIYPWGDEKPDEQRCNYGMNVGDTTPVGQYSPQGDSPYGCADMAGNVEEWCGDWCAEDAYSTLLARNPRGPEDGQRRVVRGGSWYCRGDIGVRSALRHSNYEVNDGVNRGFRCAAPQSP